MRRRKGRGRKVREEERQGMIGRRQKRKGREEEARGRKTYQV